MKRGGSLAWLFLFSVAAIGPRCLLAAAPARRPASAPTIDSAASDLVEYLSRSNALKENDVEGRLALARWAYNHQMYEQAVEMADQALYRDPGNRAAYTVLQQVDDARPLPADPDAETALKEEMRVRFERNPKHKAPSKHFLLVYDTSDAFATQRAATMEKVYDAFRFYFNMKTLRPEFLNKRLPVLLLKDREDYIAYGSQTEKGDIAWTAGFYSQRTNRATFFDESSGSSATSFSREIDTLKSQIAELNTQIDTARGTGQLGILNMLTVQRNRVNESLAQINARVGMQVAAQNNSKTMHEAAHQVAFNLGIQVRVVDYPMWFSEGLACSFEFEDGQGHRGPALLNTGRIAAIKEALRDDKLMPLAKFIADDTPDPSEERARGIAYAQGWALFHYLYKFQRVGLEDYILAFKAHARNRPIGPDERAQMFTNAFGRDLVELDRKFVAYLRSLPGRAGP